MKEIPNSNLQMTTNIEMRMSKIPLFFFILCELTKDYPEFSGQWFTGVAESTQEKGFIPSIEEKAITSGMRSTAELRNEARRIKNIEQGITCDEVFNLLNQVPI